MPGNHAHGAAACPGSCALSADAAARQVAVFQHVSALKRQLDAGEVVDLPPEMVAAPNKGGREEAEIDELVARIQAELDEAARG